MPRISVLGRGNNANIESKKFNFVQKYPKSKNFHCKFCSSYILNICQFFNDFAFISRHKKSRKNGRIFKIWTKCSFFNLAWFRIQFIFHLCSHFCRPLWNFLNRSTEPAVIVAAAATSYHLILIDGNILNTQFWLQ